MDLAAALAAALAQNAAQAVQNSAQAEEIAALRRELAETKAAHAKNTAQLARMTERLDELLELAHRHAKPKRGRRTRDDDDEPPPPPMNPDLTDEQRAAFEERPRPPEPPKREQATPTEQRRPGRLPVPDHLERDTAVLPPGVCACGCDQTILVDSVTEEKLDAVVAQLRARETRRQIGECVACGARVMAPAPAAPFARSKLTCEALAVLMHMTYALLVPLDRVGANFRGEGVKFSMGFLVKQKERAAKLLEAIDAEHWSQLMSRPWLQVDGTGHKVIVEGLPGTQHAYLEVYRNTDVVVFRFGLNKLGSTLMARLGGYAGTVLCDAESRNGVLFEDGQRVEAGCNAHLRRALEDAESEHPLLAQEAIAYVQEIYRLHRASVAQGLRGQELRSFREREIVPVYERFSEWGSRTLPTLMPSDTLASVLRYLHRHRAALTRWLSDPSLPPDNNDCEREFQHVAKGRHAWLFFGGPKGGRHAATLLGVSATCRAIGVSMKAYLAWAFARLGTAAAQFGNLPAASLTPAAYKIAMCGAG